MNGRALAIVAGAALLLLVAGASVIALRGRTRLNEDGVVTLDGVLPADPEGLAVGARCADVNRYALARVIASEVGGLPRAAQIAGAHATLNTARARGLSVRDLVTAQHFGKGASRHVGPGNGYFGKQNGRYCATSRDPSSAHLALADDCVTGVVSDPYGARQWDSPEAFGVQEGTTAATLVTETASRRKANRMVLVEGVPERKLRLWVPT